ncbi:hypothetical protein [Oscillibacter sp.]|uniref:hypothetical protein n=1 Tax=Oscillibacter sp. TaxID=1945593 RepID=UPI0028B1AFF9|nr:hypothetical protein [Oscillibacter sp.]
MGRQSHEIALCGVTAALGTVLLTLGSIIPGATYCAPLLGMLTLLPVLSERGPRPALSVYAVTTVLALLLAPNKESALVYLLLGYYPVLRPVLDRLRLRFMRLLCKLAVFNAAVAVLYFLLRAVGLDVLNTELAGCLKPLSAAFLLGANLTFLLIDRVLGQMTLLWQCHLRKLFFRH